MRIDWEMEQADPPAGVENHDVINLENNSALDFAAAEIKSKLNKCLKIENQSETPEQGNAHITKQLPPERD